MRIAISPRLATSRRARLIDGGSYTRADVHGGWPGRAAPYPGADAGGYRERPSDAKGADGEM